MRQLGLTAYRWITPHGLARLVTPRGTTRVEVLRARDGTVLGECYPDPAVDLIFAGLPYRGLITAATCRPRISRSDSELA